MTQPRRSAALGDQLAELLRSQIIRAELEAGTHLVEDVLASTHDVSRGPVRDALRILTGEGLVESRRRGYFVKPFTETDVDELYQIREAMEQVAFRLAAQQSRCHAGLLDRSGAGPPGSGDDDRWAAAEAHLDSMRRFADAGDWPGYATADLAFHSEFYELAGNARLAALWRQYRPTFAALLDVTNAQDADLHPSAEDHAELLRCARDGSLQPLGEVVTRHLEGSARRMKQALRFFTVGRSPITD